jgi:hypothetical protein
VSGKGKAISNEKRHLRVRRLYNGDAKRQGRIKAMGFSRATQSESHRKGRFPGAAWCEPGPMIQFPFGFLPLCSAKDPVCGAPDSQGPPESDHSPRSDSPFFAFGLPQLRVTPGPTRCARQFRESLDPNRCYSAPARTLRTAINDRLGGRVPHVHGTIRHELLRRPCRVAQPSKRHRAGSLPVPRRSVVRAVRSGSHILRGCMQ